MSIIKVASVLIMSGALLNLAGCCQHSCSDKGVSAQCNPNACVQPAVAINANKTTVVNFAYNSAELSAKDADILLSQVSILLANQNLSLQIAGHTDEIGSDAYNLALGERRAKAVANALESKGIASDRITIISYGKMKPLVNEKGEQANSLNRRAELGFVENSKVG